MSVTLKAVTPVLPAGDVEESLDWWIRVCGFTEAFRDSTPPRYAGITRGSVSIHIGQIGDKETAKLVGEQTMVRILADDVKALYAEYQERGGQVHPNGPLQKKPWGSMEFSAIDPCGVCVTFAG